MKGIDKKDLDMILQWFSNSDLVSAVLEYNEKGAFKIELSRAANTQAQAVPHGIDASQMPSAAGNTISPPPAATKDVQNDEHKEVKAPIVGTFYRSSNPDVPPFAQVGDTIKKGQTLCILEAMKVMNEFEAEFDMEIVDILVENTTLVEHDQPLFRVIPL